MRITTVHCLVFSFAVSLMISPLVARCDEAAKTPSADNPPALAATSPIANTQVSREAVNGNLDEDATLQVKVSFEAKRLLLNEVLAKLQQQSGVILQASADSPATRVSLTVRVKDMPLCQLMNSLSRLYGVKWNKTGDKAYQMLPSGLTEEQLKALQIGDPYWFRSFEHTPSFLTQRRQESEAVAAEILNEADVQQLRTPTGVPVADLSAELQQKVHRQVESGLASALVDTEDTIQQALAQPWTLQFGADPGVKNTGLTSPSLRVLAPDGSLITSLPLTINPPVKNTTRPNTNTTAPYRR